MKFICKIAYFKQYYVIIVSALTETRWRRLFFIQLSKEFNAINSIMHIIRSVPLLFVDDETSLISS